MRDNPQGQLFVGLIILVLGVLALVDNLNLFYMRNVMHFWPTIFIVFGVLQLKKPVSPKHKLLGVALILVGVLLTLNNMGVIHFQLRDWWPLLLIAIGVKTLFFDRHRFGRGFGLLEHTNQDQNEGRLDITTILSGSQGNVSSQDFKFADITAILGGAELDFRQANIVDEATLDVTAIMGGVVLKVPRDWVVVNQMTSFMGGSHDKTMPSADARKRLIVTGTAFMGGIEIKN